MAYKIVLVRHGESQYNLDNRFCGWHDSDLSEKGIAEAILAGESLQKAGFSFDIAYTSVLKRAIKTLFYIQDGLDLHWIPVVRHWRLNERMYGGLQGLNKSETAAKHGEEKVKIWRRAYDIPPPEMTPDHPDFLTKDPKYKNLDPSVLPKTECLKDTVERFIPFWHDHIAPAVKSGKSVIIVAHGNSLRALVKYLDKVEDSAIVELNIPTGIPLVYELDNDFKPIKHYYLADEAKVKAAMDAVAAQGKAK
ncbi:hypothetical protein GJ496_002220 [Pomphorhynchus laevis]|nr:hypothetical protein GJ496_002220 [Pomphorhynchus laevis]